MWFNRSKLSTFLTLLSTILCSTQKNVRQSFEVWLENKQEQQILLVSKEKELEKFDRRRKSKITNFVICNKGSRTMEDVSYKSEMTQKITTKE